ncbi:MAG: ATP-binding protein [Myxococcota bacterium]
MLRPLLLAEIRKAFSVHPVVALLGPRQVGKTTLARQFIDADAPDFDTRLNYFDLEDPTAEARLANPMLALGELSGLVVIDEVQRAPGLFRALRVLVDRPESAARVLILGSASRDLLRQSSETLAGRIGFIEVDPLSLLELGDDPQARRHRWLRGGFPRSLLAASDETSWLWRRDYVRTFLERDIPALGIQIPPESIRRFWLMLSHYHGQVFSASELGRSLGIGDTTVARYLDILSGTFMVRRLGPWFENIGKRQLKRPKIYFRDTGLFHFLTGIRSDADLQTHPKLGASWEGHALEQVVTLHRAGPDEAYFWGVHGQAELDLLIVQDGRKLAYEFKFTDAPRVTPSLRRAMELLHPDSVSIVCPGNIDAPLAEGVRAIGLDALVARAVPSET